jgi:metal-sulfur cluster biosynthetic enzyme
VGFREESPPLEEVRFLRDEVANMVWAIEHTVLDGLGLPVDGFDAQMERRAREREIVEAVAAALRGVIDPRSGEDIVSSGIVAGARFAGATELVLALVFEESEPEDARAADRAAANRATVCDAAEEAALSVEGVTAVRIESLTTPVAEEEAADSEGPPYRLSSTVPANWIPFLPADPQIQYAPGQPQGPGRPSVKLWRGQMLRNEEDEDPVPIEAMTRLLDPGAEGAVRWLHEEAVTRAGVKVQRTVQRVRWTKGETYVWLGRKLVTGRGEGSSGLRFDSLKEWQG